jgi:hypothetical protein
LAEEYLEKFQMFRDEINNKCLIGALDVWGWCNGVTVKRMGGYGCNGRLPPKMHRSTDVDG